MGNRFSRRRDAPVSSVGTAATEQKTVAEQAEDTEVTQTQEVVETEKIHLMAEESLTPEERSPKDECADSAVSALKNDAESEPEAQEAPAEPEPLVSAIKLPEPEGSEQPEPVTEARLALKPDLGFVPEPESAPHTEADVEPISEPAPFPAEPLEQNTDLLNQEFLPESLLSSPPLINLGALDVSLSPNLIPVSINPGESHDISPGEQCDRMVEAAGVSTLEPENFTEISTFLEKPTEVEAAEFLKMAGSDVDQEKISEILKNSELKENDLLNDLIQSEAKIPDDKPITNLSMSVDLM